MEKRLDEILQECIARLEAGQEDIESLVRRYPEHAEELRAHLQVWSRLSAVERAAPTPQGAMRGRQRLLSAIAASGRKEAAGLIRNLSSEGGSAMRLVAAFVAGGAIALAIAFFTGSLDFDKGGSGTVRANPVADCLAQLDLNGDGVLDVQDVEVFRQAIENQDLAFDFNGDGTVDVFDVSALALDISECLFNIQGSGGSGQEFPQ